MFVKENKPEEEMYMQCLKCQDGYFSGEDLKGLTGIDTKSVECMNSQTLDSVIGNNNEVELSQDQI